MNFFTSSQFCLTFTHVNVVFFCFANGLRLIWSFSQLSLCLTCSSSVSSAPPFLRLVIHSKQRPGSLFSRLTNSFTTETIMSDKKRKATSAAATGPSAKQQKLAPMKEEKKQRAAGWLQDLVKEQRTEKKEMKFNKKRLRFLSDTQKIKQGSEGVLYWMLRDQRVQGKHLKTLTARNLCSLHFLCV